MHKKKQHLSNIIIFLLLSAVLLHTGCANTSPQPPVETTQHDRRLTVAENFFITGNYTKALAEYERVFNESVSEADKIKALYGLACTRMILAENDEDLISAIDDLQRWDTSKGSAPFTENRHMLVVALKEKGMFMLKQFKDMSESDRKKDKRIADQKRTINQMSSRLEKLQKQLEELEAVEEKFQGKRKPL